jgi:hypothetical protein
MPGFNHVHLVHLATLTVAEGYEEGQMRLAIKGCHGIA